MFFGTDVSLEVLYIRQNASETKSTWCSGASIKLVWAATDNTNTKKVWTQQPSKRLNMSHNNASCTAGSMQACPQRLSRVDLFHRTWRPSCAHSLVGVVGASRKISSMKMDCSCAFILDGGSYNRSDVFFCFEGIWQPFLCIVFLTLWLRKRRRPMRRGGVHGIQFETGRSYFRTW